MTDTSINLNAHYTSNSKVDSLALNIANPPADIPTRHVFNDAEANKRLKLLNEDIYQSQKKEKKRDVLTFIKWFSAFVIAILTFKGIKHFFK